MLKALLILEIFFDYVEEQLNKKVKVNFQIYDVTDCTTNILPNFSRNKGNQEMKFSQLLKYNVRNIFRKKSCRK